MSQAHGVECVEGVPAGRSAADARHHGDPHPGSKIFQRLSSQSIWQEGILVHHLHGYFVRTQLNDVSMHAEALY